MTALWGENKERNSNLVNAFHKTLFKQCGGTIEQIVKLYCLCCIMKFRWINKQPGMQMF